MNIIEASDHTLLADQYAVWLQANRHFGCMVPELEPNWQLSRQRAVGLMAHYTVARQVVRMRSVEPGLPAFIDLDQPLEATQLHQTDGLITTNPNYILHANPADCGEIALAGFSVEVGRPVIALLHASRHVVNGGGYLKALDYLTTAYNVQPEILTVRLSPSARAESYAFSEIDEEQRTSRLWRDYVWQDENGQWHVDFHQRTVDDLLAFGIPGENIYASSVDTVVHPDYFSHFSFTRGLKPQGGNGLFFAASS